ncbi:Uncharacterized conserved protein YlxW, UPF0749 family [Pelagirhabdus alkalitolerans]|uniref:Uncharacterized conserved protein YlxW, UPF0749 family n=1 Tax=Pelagirhabdus alkalitolerans TaxID=1612202 RepID=A0A1G6GZZ0_9BACI|nr:DUF881 domain-containing protein [Pelagirhabdus alkalitolerans]SDB87617.1 Uncharacterized conserved protein YlxW, UPF0749 family [Pelagirhabdus alkalitolerans]
MSIKTQLIFALVLFSIGFLTVIFFQTSDEEDIRQTRDMWELRSDLEEQQELQQRLQSELNELRLSFLDYESNSTQDQIETLNQSVQQLEKEAGLTQIESEGIKIELKPNYSTEDPENGFPNITPELLHRLINELNAYGANAIAIGEERLMNYTAIREVDDRIYMNQRPLPNLPVTIKVTGEDVDRLYNYMEVSPSKDEFAMHNVTLDITKENHVTLPAYAEEIDFDYISVNEEADLGES